VRPTNLSGHGTPALSNIGSTGDRGFESISLLQRVYCELRSRRMKKCRVLDAARKRGWRTEPAREPLPPQNEPP
jgi:hypothetical protein